MYEYLNLKCEVARTSRYTRGCKCSNEYREAALPADYLLSSFLSIHESGDSKPELSPPPALLPLLISGVTLIRASNNRITAD